MKKQVKSFVSLVMVLCAVFLSNAQEKSSEFEVLGNCNGCKKRIEKAANSLEGVASATWNKDTKILQVAYDSNKTSLEEVSKAINEVGHDTKFGRASDGAYDALPGCCQYDRKSDSSSVSTETAVASFDFQVLGNCGMCKKRIEKAARAVPGVTSAEWNKETKMVNIDVSDKAVSKDKVSEAIAAIGHDTEFHRAEVSTYDDLPGCCQYDRMQ
ncbi:heavy-metal-associated domain-containing protein [Flagellimonas meridianipacifica]|uniref:Copper chaperone CopZ n=1 Tax=Flagellimonas meridianipacifica TaxID=1080225 RepID=A0A2T0MF33_9FLAO|nr:heavy-metal-associated domain-containing protein [Allomuricauda pacifica]PRX56146.1 copper chaperone CopZ [Allomuricauda pacifica]